MIPSGLRLRAGTALRLGPRNILRILHYRASLKLGVGAVRAQPVPVPGGDLFPAVDPNGTAYPEPPVAEPLRYFGWKSIDIALGSCPDWFLDPFTGKRFVHADRPWHELPDFPLEGGDIKCIWELSRWDWLLHLAQAVRHGAHASTLEQLNRWLRDWIERNPAYRGPNWKCGQEASIRVIHLAVAAHILGQVSTPSAPLLALVRLHLRRIAPTVEYAIAQDNNHGTGEAAALFIGGTWLARHDRDADSARWASFGRNLLEERVLRLVMEDGSFSQYSVNYHRLMLDTLCVCEWWRRRLVLPEFSSNWLGRATAAVEWLRNMVQASSGDAPSVGANDGAYLLPLTKCSHRDFRPSVQLAATLFLSARAYPPGPWDGQLAWLDLPLPESRLAAPASRCYIDGGYAVLREGNASVLVCFPRFRFRPSQADALHLDLWVAGDNWLRDAGTYGYNTTVERWQDFSSTASHNTVQFDDRDQMPRLSRFLYGAWLETDRLEEVARVENEQTFAAGYVDWLGARHRRAVRLAERRLDVVDEISGFEHKAVLRWRLAPGAWRLNGNVISSAALTIEVAATEACSVRLTEGQESRHYLQATPVPVLEAEVRRPCRLTTVFRWS